MYFSDSQITAGAARLQAGKLTPKDVDSLVSALRWLVGNLETRYSFKFEADLSALDDAGNDRARAAKCAAALVRLEELEFSDTAIVPMFGTNGGTMDYSEKRDAISILIGVFTLFYPLPPELSNIENMLLSRFSSGTAQAYRSFNM